VILHFGDWHGEPPLVSQVYSERVLTFRVPLLVRGKLGRSAGTELYIFGILARGQKRRWWKARFWRKAASHTRAAARVSVPLAWRYCQHSHFGCKTIRHVGCRQRCTPQKTLGQWPQCRADRQPPRAQPQRRVRQVAAHGLEARAQAADRKA
jgi:hypothetical protein